MRYPKLTQFPAARQTLDTFGGLNRLPDAGEGEFTQMENLSGSQFPFAAAGKSPRAHYRGSVSGLLSKDQLCFVEEGSLYIGAQEYPLDLTEGDKQLVSMGAYILILPDKVYFNTADPADTGRLSRSIREKFWMLTPCDAQGTPRTVKFLSETLPESPQTGDFWCDTSAQRPVLKQLAADGSWQVTQGYVRLSLDHIRNEKYPYRGYFTDNFTDGDTLSVTIEGDQVLDAVEEAPMEDSQLTQMILALSGDHRLKLLDGIQAVIPGVLPKIIGIGNYIRFGRFIPDMDLVFECGNRLWGCRWGDQEGKFVNEIYASALGDFRNWTSFQGLSTDAYTASVGSDGPFTGALSYFGTPLFFKENCVHRVYGSYPAEYRIQTTHCRGVAPGCGGTVALLGDEAVYLGRDAVYAYDGAMPRPISRQLGELSGPGLGAVAGERYYLSIPEGLYVYDSHRRFWHRSSPMEATTLCSHRGSIYCAAGGDILELEADPPGDWSVTTGILSGDASRWLRSVGLELILEPGSHAQVWVSYDGGPWQHCGTVTGRGRSRVYFPLHSRRCGYLQLRLSGHGPMTLCRLTKTLEKGSELP